MRGFEMLTSATKPRRPVWNAEHSPCRINDICSASITLRLLSNGLMMFL
jgi:hypothetical protein